MLRIKVQPQYISQCGKICGESKDQSVKVTLEVPKSQNVSSTGYYVLCTLHMYNDICRQDTVQLLPLSSYWIEKKSEIINDDNTGDDEVKPSQKNIFDLMKLEKSLNNKNLVFTYKLHGHIILDAVEEEREISMLRRMCLLQKLNIELPDVRWEEQWKHEKSVLCLGFTAFEKHESKGNFTRITRTIYSNSFDIEHKCILDYIVPKHGDVEGGNEVALFLNSNKVYKKANVKLFINSKTDLIADIEILQKNENRSRNIFINNKTIIFTTPPLPKELRTSLRNGTMMVFIEVYFPSTKETSNSLIFPYYEYQQGNVSEAPSASKQTSGNTITIYDAAKPSVKVAIVTKSSDWIVINYEYANGFNQHFGDIFKSCVHIVPQFPQCKKLRVEVDNGYEKDLPLNAAILSEAIESRFREKNETSSQPMVTCTAKSSVDKKSNSASEVSDALDVAADFFIDYKDVMNDKESKKQLFPAAARTIDYDWYYTHTLKKQFRPTVDASCSIVEKDLRENTVLHSAIALNHSKCIGQFIDMFTNSTEYPKSYQEELKNVFSVYDREGHTILHTAILNNREDLLKVMLEFCQKNQINVEDCRIFGSGESIQQLAVKSGLPNIAALVLRYTSRVKYSEDGQQVEETDLKTD